MAELDYQSMIRALEGYWADYGCVLMQPYHTELGAGTANPTPYAVDVTIDDLQFIPR